MRFVLSQREAAGSIPGEFQVHKSARGVAACALREPSLRDAEERLRAPARRSPLAAPPLVACALRPRRASGGSRGDVLGVAVGTRRLVERHHHVGAQASLQLNHDLRREAMRRAVEMGAEGDAVVVDGGESGQAHHLEPAGVGERRAVPSREASEAAGVADRVGAGTKHQVIRIRQHDARLARAQVRHGEPLHRGARSDRHERGRRHLAVRGGEDSGARPRRAGRDREREARAFPAHEGFSKNVASPYE